MGVCPYPPGFGEGLVRLKTAGREAQSGYQRDHSLKTAGRPLVLQPDNTKPKRRFQWEKAGIPENGGSGIQNGGIGGIGER